PTLDVRRFCHHSLIHNIPYVHYLFFFFYSYGDSRDLHSFPTRRSSDLLLLRRQHLDGDPEHEHGLHQRQAVLSRGRSHAALRREDRKSTRLNSSHVSISYAVFCLKKKKKMILPLLVWLTPDLTIKPSIK